MRVPTLPMLLAVACLLGASGAVLAQTTSAVPMQRPTPSANAGAEKQPLAWSRLSDGQQRMLAPLQGDWNQMQPERQHRLAEHALHWTTLPPERQQQIQERLTRWSKMTPEQRRQVRENARAFHNLTPEQRAKVSEAFRKFQSLPPEQRRALRERWRTMTPEQRRRWATGHADKPVPTGPPAHQSH
ncbi:MAG TPA: DUF3106 domain-containing protein [Rhodanobacteraceae bacterium]|nr:DUF3106 domain-containing protein [Rhodanobacteraceae bacterium]